MILRSVHFGTKKWYIQRDQEKSVLGWFSYDHRLRSLALPVVLDNTNPTAIKSATDITSSSINRG